MALRYTAYAKNSSQPLLIHTLASLRTICHSSEVFSGIIRDRGTVTSALRNSKGYRLTITTPLSAELAEGDSIAVNGVCLTVVAPTKHQWQAHVMPETLRRTNIGRLHANMVVNLERPLQLQDRLDGHFVQGHIDGVCEVIDITPEGNDRMFSFALPPALLPYLIPKGSVALDGVSLTVVDIKQHTFRVSMMPYTLQQTTFQNAVLGYHANIEVDMLGKYVVHLAASFKASKTV